MRYVDPPTVDVVRANAESRRRGEATGRKVTDGGGGPRARPASPARPWKGLNVAVLRKVVQPLAARSGRDLRRLRRGRGPGARAPPAPTRR
eukprot:6830129-Alexandrium_andersonii.AAC.1